MKLVFASSETEAAVARVVGIAREAGGRALLVGGTVRDTLLGLPAREIDVEVFGIPPHRLLEILGAHFTLDLVGKAFGVVKLRDHPIDVSIPRRESKRGLGHKGFEIRSDPDLTPEEAALRRDFTINAVAFDPLTGERIDPLGGARDLEARILRHAGPQFAEDPLRVLRAMQLAARFDLAVAKETVALCSTLDLEELPRERIFEEWKKLLLLGKRPSLGLAFLREAAWIRFFPELAALIGCPQDPEWHPEGDVWIHTLHCMDAFAGERIGDALEDLVVGFGVLCHDLGKPSTTVSEGGRIRSPGHEPGGLEPTRRFLARLTDRRDLFEAVLPLVRHHLRPDELYRTEAGDAAVRRLARSAGRIDRLVRVARADRMGRPPLPFDGFPAGTWLLERAEALAVKDAVPRPLVMGRHLIALGLEPGPRFREILDRCYEAQLDGTFDDPDGGVRYVRNLLGLPDGFESER